jgi:cell division protease FtsH
VTVDQMSFGEFSPAWLEAHRVDLRRIHRDEIVGIGHVQREVASLVGRLRNPELVRSAGADLPRGILFHGSPGTGKTLTARSLALQLGEDVPFYELSSDEVSPDRARMTLRYLADRFTRSVLYIDEIDGFALHRDADQQTTTTRAVLVAFLAALDGLVESEGPIVIASSNRQPWQLDPALTRPGRLGFAVAFDEPDEEERVQLFELFARRRPLDGAIDWLHLAQLSRGQSPAALRQALDDALGLALAEGRTAIRQADVLEALRRHGQIWPEVVLDADEVRRICVHEAGHVAAGIALLGPSYVYSVDVTERGGVTHLGKDEQNHITIPDSLLRAQVVFGYAGIAAEQVVFGEHSRPSDDDVEAVTQKLLSRIEHGLDEHFPPVAPSAFGERLAEALRERLMSIVVGHAEEARAIAGRIVADNAEGIKRFAEILYEKRPLTGEALQEAIARAGFVQPEPLNVGWAG